MPFDSPNKKLNRIQLSIDELRVGNLVRVRSIAITGDYLADPKDFVIAEVHRCKQTLVVEYFGTIKEFRKAPQEIFHSEHVAIMDVAGVPLWKQKRIDDELVKSFGFIAEPQRRYSLQVQADYVLLIDALRKDECVQLEIHTDGREPIIEKIWFAHELQNVIKYHTGILPENDLIRRILVPVKNNQ